MPRERPGSGSTLMLEEYFASQHPGFVQAVREVSSPKALAALADRWTADPRPWARGQMFLYLAEPMDRPGHQPLVKRLFKHAEAAGDDELMAAFLVSFDLLVRRIRKTHYHYDYRTRQATQTEYLKTPRNSLSAAQAEGRWGRNPATGQVIQIPPRRDGGRGRRLFSYRTRYYLRRRAWRYFRRMGFGRPAQYCQAVARALAAYRDEDLARGEHILDSWGLMQACFRCHDALLVHTSRFLLKDGRRIGELTPAPRFPALWRSAEAMGVLLWLVGAALSRLVRLWAMQLLRAEHAERLRQIAPEQLIPLLDHADEEVQQFGAELFGQCSGLESLPLATWLRLLETQSPTALAILCEAMTRHVSPQRLDFAQCVDLACAAPAPVARMGLSFCRERPSLSAEDRTHVSRLAEAKCAAVAGQITEWALPLVGRSPHYDRDAVVGFFDSLLAEARAAAWAWLKPGGPGYDDPQLWAKLLETPFDDLRLRVIDLLQKRANLPGAAAEDLAGVWAAVLLGVHRGGRQKLKAVRQLANAIAAEPPLADRLLPVLAVAIRSIRGPERRAGLAAAVSLIEAGPQFAAQLAAAIPELQIPAEEAAT